MAGNTRLWKHEEGRLGLWCKDTHKKVGLSTITSRMSLTGSFPSLHFFLLKGLHIIKLCCWWPDVTHWILSHKDDICIDLCFRILMIDYQKVHFQSILFGKQECLSFMLKIFSFQLPKETDHIRQRAETLELASWHSTLWKPTAESTPTVTVFCLKLPLPKTLDRAQEGVMGEGGRGRWLSAIELCTLTVQLWTKKS